MTLTYILIATLVGGVVSVLLAAALTAPMLAVLVRHLVSLSTGVLLGTALLHVLPEAFESHASPHALFLTLLGGLLFFFLLEKAELYRHGHHHEHDDHHHHHGFDKEQAGRGGWSVLVGDSIHNFCDGVLIAAAFLVDPDVGLFTALAIILHEIPQEVGDYIVLINAGFSKRKALFYNALSGMAAVLGGVFGEGIDHVLPHLERPGTDGRPHPGGDLAGPGRAVGGAEEFVVVVDGVLAQGVEAAGDVRAGGESALDVLADLDVLVLHLVREIVVGLVPGRGVVAR